MRPAVLPRRRCASRSTACRSSRVRSRTTTGPGCTWSRADVGRLVLDYAASVDGRATPVGVGRGRPAALPAPEPVLRVGHARADRARRVRRPARVRPAGRGQLVGRLAPVLRARVEPADRRRGADPARPCRACAATTRTSSSRCCAPSTCRPGWCRCTHRACPRWTSTPSPRPTSTAQWYVVDATHARAPHAAWCGSRPAVTRRTPRSSTCTTATPALDELERHGGRRHPAERRRPGPGHARLTPTLLASGT